MTAQQYFRICERKHETYHRAMIRAAYLAAVRAQAKSRR